MFCFFAMEREAKQNTVVYGRLGEFYRAIYYFVDVGLLQIKLPEKKMQRGKVKGLCFAKLNYISKCFSEVFKSSYL